MVISIKDLCYDSIDVITAVKLCKILKTTIEEYFLLQLD